MKLYLIIAASLIQSGVCHARDMVNLNKLAELVSQSKNQNELVEFIPKDSRVLFYNPAEKIILIQEDCGAAFAILKADKIKPYFSFGKMKMSDPLAVAIGTHNKMWDGAKVLNMSETEIVFELTLKNQKTGDNLIILKSDNTKNSFWRVRQ